MPNENQQTTTPAPAANDTKTSWNFGDFAKGFETPFTKNPDDSLNLAGALLVGGGSGLASWVLSRMLGIKGGPSLGISILAALAGAHGSLAMQSGGDIFNFDYLKGLMDKNREDKGKSPTNQTGENGSVIDKRFMATPTGQRAAGMTSDDIRNRLEELDRGGSGNSQEARTLMAELQSRNEAINLKYSKQENKPVSETETQAMITALDELREREAYIKENYPDNVQALKDIADARAEIQEKMKQAIINDEGQLNWNRDQLMKSQVNPREDAIGNGSRIFYPTASPQQLMESQINPAADKMGNGTTFYPSLDPGKDLQRAMIRSRYRMMDNIPSGGGGNLRLGTVYPHYNRYEGGSLEPIPFPEADPEHNFMVMNAVSPIAIQAAETAKTSPTSEPIPKVPEPEQSIKLPNISVNPRLRYHPSFINPLTAYFGTAPHGISRQRPISKPVTPPRPQIRWNSLPPGMNPNDAIQMVINPNDEIANAIRNQ